MIVINSIDTFYENDIDISSCNGMGYTPVRNGKATISFTIQGRNGSRLEGHYTINREDMPHRYEDIEIMLSKIFIYI